MHLASYGRPAKFFLGRFFDLLRMGLFQVVKSPSLKKGRLVHAMVPLYAIVRQILNRRYHMIDKDDCDDE